MKVFKKIQKANQLIFLFSHETFNNINKESLKTSSYEQDFPFKQLNL